MKIVSFEISGTQSFGVVREDSIIDIGSRVSDISRPEDMLDGEVCRVAERVADGAGVDYALEDVTLLIPVLRPEKILCIGVNYRDRNEEYQDGSEQASYPSMFFRTRDSFVGHHVPIIRPPESEQLDYEGEIAIVIGKDGRRIPRDVADSHIAALTCLNEGTIRDWTRHAKFNVTQGKNFDRSGSIGPWMVTADEFDGYGDLAIETRVNGEIRQKDNTRRLVFDFSYLISYVSTFMTLRRGDIISTGTPTGAGVRHDPPIWLAPGDTVEVEVSGIGVLRNEVADENF